MPEALGPIRFGRVLACLRLAVRRYAPQATTGASYDPATWEKTGYQIGGVVDRLGATRILLSYEAALNGQPMPWTRR